MSRMTIPKRKAARLTDADYDVSLTLHANVVRFCEEEMAVTAPHSREYVFAKYLLQCAVHFHAPAPMPGDVWYKGAGR